jgi:NIMA (never in mitosis gene a)-related kinase
VEFADGGDLASRIKNAVRARLPFPEDQILDWFTQICYALKHVHDHKLIHRNLRADNIFLMQSGTVKLGITRQLRPPDFEKSVIEMPYYLSPEICLGKPYTSRTDIWSLGCVLYEMCTLTHPFDAMTIASFVMKTVRCKPDPVPAHYSQQLRDLIGQLLDKSPGKRPTVDQILSLDFLAARADHLLDEETRKKEFSIDSGGPGPDSGAVETPIAPNRAEKEAAGGGDGI